MIAVTHTVALTGLDGTLVQIETMASQGLPGIHIVGLGDKAVREAAQRVRSALKSSGLPLPPRKYTVNLAPADLHKDGSHYDLAIALSLLVASGQLPQKLAENGVFFGELSLSGEVRPTRGALIAAECAQHHSFERLYLADASVEEAHLITGIDHTPTPSLKALYLHLRGVHELPTASVSSKTTQASSRHPVDPFGAVVGQEHAKRALTIAMAGRHHILMIGPPGVGKTLLAESARKLLPPLSEEQQIMTHKIALIANVPTEGDTPPFRSPHHSASPSSLIGNQKGKPGEISLAHTGVLFLDELSLFRKETLDALRQPMESRTIRIGTGKAAQQFPADCCIIAAMNPCSCGYYGNERASCRCSDVERRRYWRRLSGPIIDRFDLVISLKIEDEKAQARTTLVYKKQRAKELECLYQSQQHQHHRYNSSYGYNGNSSLRVDELELDKSAEELLAQVVQARNLNLRRATKIARVARTIADMEGSAVVSSPHIAEAVQYHNAPIDSFTSTP